MIALIAAQALAHIPVLVYASPEDDWCAVFRDTDNSGDIVLLAPGDYYGPCDLFGKPPNQYNEYSVLTAQDSDYRPRIHWDGVSDHILGVSGTWVQVAWLIFPEVPAGVDAIRVTGGDTHWMLDSEFTLTGGTAVRADAKVDSLRLTELDVHGDGTGTGVAVGCPDESCSVSNLVFEDSLLRSLAIGAAIDGSDGSVQDNVIDALDALDVAGTPSPELNVARNLVRGSVTAHGPSVWENNMVVGSFASAAGAGPYRNVALYGNTVYDPGGAPLDLSGWTEGNGFVLQDNAVNAPIPAAPGEISGNAACTDPAACWVDPANLDLYPVRGGPLATTAIDPDSGRLYDDWCGFARENPPTTGALEALGGSFGPVRFDEMKRLIECTGLGLDTGAPDPGGTDDTDPPAPDDTGNPASDGGGSSPSGCGCDGGPPGVSAGLALGAVALARRRRGPTACRSRGR